jgi:ribosomal protein S18 acetylase RimI-like enzyme
MPPAPVSIRRGAAADASLLAAFAARTFAETFAATNTPEDMQAHLARAYGVPQQTAELTDPDTVTLLAERDGGLVAYAQLRRGPAPACVDAQGAIELHRFYVDRPAHGSGVARLLITAVQAAAAAAGARHLWLGVWEHNPRAIRFYEKNGFVDVGSQDFVLGADRQTDRVMVAPVPIR